MWGHRFCSISTFSNLLKENKYSYKCGGFLNQHATLLKDLKYLKRRVVGISVYVKDDTLDLLCNTFKISDEEVCQLVKYPVLKKCESIEIHRTIDYLNQVGVNGKILLMAPWLLWQNIDKLKNRSTLLNKFNLFENNEHGIGFLFFPRKLITDYKILFDSENYKFNMHRNRIYYISDQLNIPVKQFTLRAVLSWHIFHRSKEKIDEVIEILQEFKIGPQSILDDIHILIHNAALARERLLALSHISPIPSKPWVGRCTSIDFSKHFLNVKSNAGNSVLEKYQSVYHYVSSEIDYDLEDVTRFFNQHIDGHVSTKKIIRNLSTLKSFGFSQKQIRENLIVLRCSTLLIKKRMEMLKGIAVGPSEVLPSYFLGSVKGFQQYYFSQKIEKAIKQNLLCERKDVNSIIMSHDELYEFLATQLDHNVLALKQFFSSGSRKTSTTKILKNLEVLLNFQFSKEQIRGNLHALNATTDVIINRMKMLSDKGLKPDYIPLSYFTRSKKDFDKLLSYYKNYDIEFVQNVS